MVLKALQKEFSKE